ncbi:Uncharacterised protein [Shigella sonnei]|nr:Uncharacterised protein [Shigella sonnei]
MGMSAPPTLCAVFHNAHQPPRSVREYQAVNRRAHTGEPQPWKKAFSTQSTANAHSDVEKPNRMLIMPVAISPIPIK